MKSQRKDRSRPLSALALGVLTATLASCGSSSVWVRLDVEPQDALVYVNGEKVAKGHGDAIAIPFEKSGRAWIQASAPGRRPARKVFEMEELERLPRDESGNHIVDFNLQVER